MRCNKIPEQPQPGYNDMEQLTTPACNTFPLDMVPSYVIFPHVLP